MKLDLVFRPRAEADLGDLYRTIRRGGGTPYTAWNYVGRIRERCLSLIDVPEQGTRRDELTPGLRTFGFERRVTIAFRVLPGRVEIVRVLYGGRDWTEVFR